MSPLTNLRRLAVSLAMFAVVALGSSIVARADNYVLTNSNFAGNGNFGNVHTSLSGEIVQQFLECNSLRMGDDFLCKSGILFQLCGIDRVCPG